MLEHTIYEQCPWRPEHIKSIYRNIPHPESDGEWHSIRVYVGSGWYRVYQERIFQAVFAPEVHRLAKEILAIQPPESEEDSGWFCINEDGRYGITSVFALLPESSHYWGRLGPYLAPFGLEYMWDPKGFPRGWAWFNDLTTEALGGAMERLLFLEAVGREIHKLSPEGAWLHWEKYLRILDEAVTREISDNVKLLSVPTSLPRSGPKRRIATELDVQNLM